MTHAQIWRTTLELYMMDGLHQQAACDVVLMCAVLMQVQTAGKTEEISAQQEGFTDGPEQIQANDIHPLDFYLFINYLPAVVTGRSCRLLSNLRWPSFIQLTPSKFSNVIQGSTKTYAEFSPSRIHSL